VDIHMTPRTMWTYTYDSQDYVDIHI
jgi:hypothetical protein